MECHLKVWHVRRSKASSTGSNINTLTMTTSRRSAHRTTPVLSLTNAQKMSATENNINSSAVTAFNSHLIS